MTSAGPQPDSPAGTGPRPWRSIFVDAVSVPWQTVRLLLRHFPTLFVAAMAGLIARNLVIDLAVHASAVAGVLGQLVLVLAPLCVLSSYVVILRTVRSSLPNVAPATTADPGGALPHGRRAIVLRVNTALNEVGGLLIPFLLVYSTSGQLRSDYVRYSHGVLESVNNNAAVAIFSGGSSDEGELSRRMLYSLNVWIWVLIGGAFLLRGAMPWVIKNLHWGWLGLAAAYAESLWMISATPLLTGVRGSVTNWVGTREVTDWSRAWHQAIVDHLGPLVPVIEWVLTQIGAVLGAATALVVVPLSWLAVGAVVYGQLISAAAATYRPTWWERTRSRWQGADPRIRRAAGDFGGSLGARFGQLAKGVGLMRSSGIVAMALFSVMFQGAQYLTGGLWLLERRLIGPHDLSPFWISIDTPLSLFNDTLTTMVLLCVVAAGVDRALRTRTAAENSAAADTATAETVDLVKNEQAAPPELPAAAH